MSSLKHSCDLNKAEVRKEDKIVFAQKTKTTISSKIFIHMLNVIYLVIKETLNSAFNSFCSISTLNHPFNLNIFHLNSASLILKRGFSCWEPEVDWLWGFVGLFWLLQTWRSCNFGRHLWTSPFPPLPRWPWPCHRKFSQPGCKEARAWIRRQSVHDHCRWHWVRPLRPRAPRTGWRHTKGGPLRLVTRHRQRAAVSSAIQHRFTNTKRSQPDYEWKRHECAPQCKHFPESLVYGIFENLPPLFLSN